MRILFVGAVEFSASVLARLISVNANVVGVCTKENSKFNSDFVSLAPLCELNDIPYILVKDINSMHSINWIRNIGPDVIFCFGWSALIKQELLSVPSVGVVGFHPAALPQNRGRHPIVWALALGLEKTASTFFFMNEGADDGDIISQREVAICYTDYARDLYNKITDTALDQIVDLYYDLEKGSYVRTAQDDSLANYWRKRNYLDGQLDFRMSTRAIYNLVRALSEPYIGAHVLYKDKEIKVWRTEEIELGKCNLEPGLVLCNTDGIVVKTYDGAIRIVKHEFDDLPRPGTYL